MTDHSRRRHVLDPPRLREFLGDILASVDHVTRDYDWLWGSAYSTERRDSGERTRRGVSGVSGDLSDGYETLEHRRRYLGEVCKEVKDARDRLMAAENHLSKLGEGHPASAVVRQATTFPSDRVSVDEARAAQERRRERLEHAGEPEGGPPWARDEVFGG